MPLLRELRDRSAMQAHHETIVQPESGSVCCGGMAMHVETIRAVARLATAVLSALDTYGDSGCATCRERARVLLTQLRRVEVKADGDEPETAPAERRDAPLRLRSI